MSAPAKPKRKNSEQRKRKSRDAARCRRGQETEIFTDLAHQLPMPYSLLTQLDKASVIRLSIAHIKLRNLITSAGIFKNTLDVEQQTIDQQFCKSLDGFVIILEQHGDIIFVSENVEKYLGMAQVEIVGHSVFDFTHPCDHDELRELLNEKPVSSQTAAPAMEDKRFGMFARMKSTLTQKGRNINIKSAAYKVISLCGSSLNTAWQSDDDAAMSMSSHCVLVGRPIADLVHSEMPLDRWTFVSRLGLNLHFVYCDEEVFDLLGYHPDDLVNKPLFKFHHAFDAEALDKAYRSLFIKGQTVTGLYRFLTKGGGFVWMETQATIIGEMQTERSRSILCINHVISEIECEDEILADVQLMHQQVSNESVSESVVIEDDADEVILYDDDNEDDDVTFGSGMQLVTEKLLGIKVLPYLNSSEPTSTLASANTGVVVNKLLAASSENSSQQLAEVSTTTLPDTMPILDGLLDDLDCGLEMRAPYIPMDDMIFGSPALVAIENSEDSASIALSTCPLDPEGLDTVDVMNTLFSGYNDSITTTTTTGPVAGVCTSAKRLHDAEEPQMNLNMMTSSVCKVQKLSGNNQRVNAATRQVQSESCGVSGSSVLRNLLTTGFDTNFGYCLRQPMQMPGEASSSSSDYETSNHSSPTHSLLLCQLLKTSADVRCITDSSTIHTGNQASVYQLLI